MKLNVRRAEKRDIPSIMDLLVQVDMVHHELRPDLFKGPATKYGESRLEEIITNENTPVFVCADEDDNVLGHAFCIGRQIVGDRVLTDVKTLYIDDICVDEAARGNHVGKALYEHVISYAAGEGFYNVTLNVWSGNEPAARFYESMGMKPQKVCMELILSR